MKIDAHQHFWKYDPVNYAWIDDSMSTIQKDFLPMHLAPVLKNNDFDASVLVQVNQTEEENDYFLDFAAKNDFIKAVIGWIDFKAADLDTRLASYANKPKLKGFRHIVQGEADDFLLDETFTQGLAKLATLDFTYDILIFERQLKAALKFVRKLPNNKLIIDHIAKPEIKHQSVNKWSNYMNAISEHENVYVKVSGMVTEADTKNWKKEDFTIYLDHVLSSFGTKRIVYGSDWPVCLVAATYEEQLDIVQTYFSKLSKTEQADIFGLNAQRFYNI
ncbi:amidohydrolase family protein [Arcticibacterium luteifluviistationis]|uniref:Amidohydrolase n=1 Tax=Arcticibacterium luteifluviistationis TaxID=1784714 RepID=A0A2Z4GD22_9BACT|nr:amidohydrolase family protein [Arcticibacterium luteifluviistationis]AWV99000.1 amidohydrolase [Arcticibacterium luteifluviistationis]